MRSNEGTNRTRLWPNSARALSGILRRLAPNFRGIGITVTFPPRQAGTGRRLIALERTAIPSSQPSQSPDVERLSTVSNALLRDGCDGCDDEKQSGSTLAEVSVPATATKGDGLGERLLSTAGLKPGSRGNCGCIDTRSPASARRPSCLTTYDRRNRICCFPLRRHRQEKRLLDW
jgi:hypothetical protein